MMNLFKQFGLLAAACVATLGQISLAGVVTLKNDNGNYQLLVDGKPFFIEGAGGGASKKFLKECGGNSFRTWGVGADTQRILDEAEELGLKVTLGIWLGHERHGFNYGNAQAVQEQFEKARDAVRRYKDHPALLMWAVGNEMEGFKDGGNPLIWKAVNDIAEMIKKEDPNHPTMTVIAEIGGARVRMIHEMCPAIDVVGINSYGGGPSVAERYRKAGGKKPFVLTEYGPPGTWEVGKNSWGAPQELTSTAKADRYRETYEKSILAEKGKLCLGGYAFTWGNKQEATATWYGLFLASGERLEATDTLTELWTGKPVPNRCPQVEPLKLLTSNRVKPGETIKAVLSVKDPEGDPLTIEWKLQKDYAEYEGGGDTQVVPPTYPEAIVENGKTEVEVKMPDEGGPYFLFATVRDNHNGAAVLNVPLYVDGGREARAPAPAQAKLPFVLFGEGQGESPYIPSGWIGKTDAISFSDDCTDNPKAGSNCMKLQFRSPNNFGGIIWQAPANDWGDKPGGLNLTGATKLTFWARGETGNEKVDFVMGVIKADKKFHDSANAELKGIVLTKEWQQYTIDLEGKDLSRIKTGFGWVVGGQGRPVTFYVDEIRYE